MTSRLFLNESQEYTMGEITLGDFLLDYISKILCMLHFSSIHGRILNLHPGISKQKLVRPLLNTVHIELNHAQTNRCAAGSLNVHWEDGKT